MTDFYNESCFPLNYPFYLQHIFINHSHEIKPAPAENMSHANKQTNKQKSMSHAIRKKTWTIFKVAQKKRKPTNKQYPPPPPSPHQQIRNKHTSPHSPRRWLKLYLCDHLRNFQTSLTTHRVWSSQITHTINCYVKKHCSEVDKF